MNATENPFAPGTALHAPAETLFARPVPPLLAKSVWSAPVSAQLRDLHGADTQGADTQGVDTHANVLAGLHLMNDELDAAHLLVQPREQDATSSYWHGILHRREGDFGNAKHWMRRAGSHPLHEPLYAEAAAGAGSMHIPLSAWGAWDAIRFVEECQNAAGGEAEALAALQWLEMRRLLQWCVANGL